MTSPRQDAIATLCDLVSPQAGRARAAADRLRREAPWLGGAVADLARAQQVAGLVHGALTDLGLAPDDDPGGLRAALAADHARAAGMNLLRFSVLATALDALQAAAIPTVVLKGAHLIEAVYGGDPGRRLMVDLDILLGPDTFAPGLAALEAAGFPIRERTARVVVLERHGVVVEAHRALAREGRLHVTTEALLARAVPLRVADRDALVLAPEDALLHLAVHLCEHAFVAHLRWFADLAWLVARVHPAIAWDTLAVRARDAHAAAALGLSLRVATELLGADVPPAFLRELAVGRLRAAWYDAWVDHRSLRFARLDNGRIADLLLALPSVDQPRDAVAMVGAFAWRRLFGG